MFANVLLVRYGTGGFQRLIEVSDAASIAEFGRYEGYLQVTDAHSEAEATARANAVIAELAAERRDITAAVLPINQWDLPYVFFGVGNTVTVPEEDDVLTAERVMSIGITEDNDSGIAGITLGLRQVVLDPDERLARAIKRAFPGAQGEMQKVARSASEP